MNIKFKKLNKTIINCNECPRLINFIKKISTEKRNKILMILIGVGPLQVLANQVQNFLF